MSPACAPGETEQAARIMAIPAQERTLTLASFLAGCTSGEHSYVREKVRWRAPLARSRPGGQRCQELCSTRYGHLQDARRMA